MQEIELLFDSCKQEIENNSDNLSFELGTEHFLSDRDYEEVNILFNLIRLNIEKPELKVADDSILTSDLRKVSAQELETILIATEKAIELPQISLKEIQRNKDSKISRILLNSDIKDNSFLFNKTAKKIIPASLARKFTSFTIDTSVSLCLAALLTFILSEFKFKELNGLITNLQNLSGEQLIPLLSLFLACFSFSFIAYPIISFLSFNHSLGSRFSGIKLVGTDKLKINKQQIMLRFLIMPLSIAILGFVNIMKKKLALHELLSESRFINNN